MQNGSTKSVWWSLERKWSLLHYKNIDLKQPLNLDLFCLGQQVFGQRNKQRKIVPVEIIKFQCVGLYKSMIKYDRLPSNVAMLVKGTGSR